VPVASCPMPCRSLAVRQSDVTHSLPACLFCKDTDTMQAGGGRLIDAFPLDGTLPPCLPYL
jgi:hypothetical protein